MKLIELKKIMTAVVEDLWWRRDALVAMKTMHKKKGVSGPASTSTLVYARLGRPVQAASHYAQLSPNPGPALTLRD
jgi:hypothetical protein